MHKHSISLADAKKMIRHFRDKKDHILNGPYKEAASLPLCETFDRAAFDKVLAKPGCTGLRIYFAMDEKLQISVVIVGVNAKNEDMISSPTPGKARRLSATSATGPTTDTTTDPDGDIIEQGTRCPDICPPDSALTTP